jgi:two-component system response regulator VanR
MRVLLIEDEPYLAEAIRDGLRLEAIAADIAGDGGTALELLSVNAYDIALLDRSQNTSSPLKAACRSSC